MLTNEDKAVLAHLVEDPDAWIRHALETVGHEAVLAKCRRAKHVSDYRDKSADPQYQPRGAAPSTEACALVAEAFAAVERAKQDAQAAKAAQQERISKLFI